MKKQEIELLCQKAIEAQQNAYAPYSKYKVGAAVLGEDGRIYTGCNVENVSYGLTVCAERIAIFKAVSEGCRKFRALSVVVQDNSGPARPCGACLQVIREFGNNTKLYLLNTAGQKKQTTIARLLPMAFHPFREKSEEDSEKKK
ncbi:MAG: cytidine deaminase [Planctomycetota bacterium]|nr:MAG: cytidine deaminase [Planctomycetota bacterium]